MRVRAAFLLGVSSLAFYLQAASVVTPARAQTAASPEPAGATQPEEALPPIVVQVRSQQKRRPKAAPRRTSVARPATPPPPATTSPTENSAGDEGPAPPPSKAAGELTVTREEIAARPIARPGEVLEAVPGLIITQHSGEGKANQYFLRGYNLDHGTDLAMWLDGMPINMRTHAHGQGYADLNFLIPELVGTMDIRKGPYYADEGDFSSVGAVHINLLDSLNKSAIAQYTLGSFGYRRFLGMGSFPFAGGTLLYAGEAATYNGPWTNPDDMHKYNGVVRYSQGTYDNGFSVTGMAYTNKWNSTDQVPLRAIISGESGLYGALDPSDGGNTNRFSLSSNFVSTDDTGALAGQCLHRAQPTQPVQQLHVLPIRSEQRRPVSSARRPAADGRQCLTRLQLAARRPAAGDARRLPIPLR
jgi:hypothetical protein